MFVTAIQNGYGDKVQLQEGVLYKFQIVGPNSQGENLSKDEHCRG